MNFDEYLQITQINMTYILIRSIGVLSKYDDLTTKESAELVREADALMKDLQEQAMDKEKFEETNQLPDVEIPEKKKGWIARK